MPDAQRLCAGGASTDVSGDPVTGNRVGSRVRRVSSLAVCVVWGLVPLTACAPERAPAISDQRVCGHSNVELAEALDHFGLEMPAQATEVRFESDVHPLFGEYFLLLRFRTTIDGLDAFLERSGLPAVADDVANPVDDWPSTCLLDPPPVGTFDYAHDLADPPHAYRVIAIQVSQPTNVLVLVKAEDL